MRIKTVEIEQGENKMNVDIKEENKNKMSGNERS